LRAVRIDYNRRVRRYRPLAILLSSALSLSALAAVAFPVTVETLARQADAIVEGTVESRESFWAEDRRHIYTLITVRRTEAWKGTTPDEVHVQVPGGRVGGLGQAVDAAPTFDDGEEVVLFLARGTPGRWTVHGLGLGKFRVVGGHAEPSIQGISFTDDSVAAGERRVGSMSLQELKRRVMSTLQVPARSP
jgi:hypothetical protein